MFTATDMRDALDTKRHCRKSFVEKQLGEVCPSL